VISENSLTRKEGMKTMKPSLMEILACPMCKSYPLDLDVFLEQDEVVEGIIHCQKCNRWFPIIDEIPYMLPDELRDGKDDIPFLKKWHARFPQKILDSGVPFNSSALEA
jgi:uncharacterized protein YbaR (Trm112 family)